MAFDRLLDSACCPHPGDALLAIASEFRDYDADRTSFRLDDFARALFAVAAERDPGAAARGLARLLTEEVRLRRDESSLEGLWLDGRSTAAPATRSRWPSSLRRSTAAPG